MFENTGVHTCKHVRTKGKNLLNDQLQILHLQQSREDIDGSHKKWKVKPKTLMITKT